MSKRKSYGMRWAWVGRRGTCDIASADLTKIDADSRALSGERVIRVEILAAPTKRKANGKGAK